MGRGVSAAARYFDFFEILEMLVFRDAISIKNSWAMGDAMSIKNRAAPNTQSLYYTAFKYRNLNGHR